MLLDSPAVEVLLDVDREYRDKARAGLLPKIALRRFNPGNKPWVPVLHTRYGPWHFTALFSDTDLARDMHRTHDWVVICFSDADGRRGRRPWSPSGAVRSVATVWCADASPSAPVSPRFRIRPSNFPTVRKISSAALFTR